MSFSPSTKTRSSATAALPVCGIRAFWKPLFRPQTGHYAGLIEEAAALWESLAQNHPFIDGNKRVAFAATYTFLAINGARITAEADATHAFIDGLYRQGAFTFENLVAWLEENVDLSGWERS